MLRNKKNGVPLLTSFNKDDVITQMDICRDSCGGYWPQISDYKRLHEENPDALFILNKRYPADLLRSFKNCNNLDKKLYKYNPELIEDKTDEGFIRFVENFYKEIEDYFAGFPETEFVTYHINEDKVDKLLDKIGSYGTGSTETNQFPMEGVTRTPKENLD